MRLTMHVRALSAGQCWPSLVSQICIRPCMGSLEFPFDCIPSTLEIALITMVHRVEYQSKWFPYGTKIDHVASVWQNEDPQKAPPPPSQGVVRSESLGARELWGFAKTSKPLAGQLLVIIGPSCYFKLVCPQHPERSTAPRGPLRIVQLRLGSREAHAPGVLAS